MGIGFKVEDLVFAGGLDSADLYNRLLVVDSQFIASQPLQRIGMMARAIKNADLDVVALQEVLKMGGSKIGNVDFLNLLQDSLQALGGPEYKVHKLQTNDLTLTMPPVDKNLALIPGKDTVSLKFAEGNAFLIRNDLEILESDSAIYARLLGPVKFNRLNLSFFSERGYQRIVVRKPGARSFEVWNTHLEIELGDISKNQGMELFTAMDSLRDTNRTQVLIGDLNFSADRGAAKMLLGPGGFSDAWNWSTGTKDSATEVWTCCQFLPANVAASAANTRIDFVMAREFLRAIQPTSRFIGPEALANGQWLFGADHAFLTTTLVAQRTQP
jgi:endonuclease/exonuclease/phosphatase family metal-dependent hydrolase